MPSRSSGPERNPAVIAICMFMACVAVAVLFAATAHASTYKMLLCAGNNGSNGYATATNTTSSQNPGGIFSLENHCGPAPDPAGDSAFLRIAENQSGGNAGVNAYGSISWTVPPWVAIIAGGGYTREPNAFNDGWRGRFWAEGWDGSTNNILMQGTNTPNSGIEWGTTSTFASHLWPFGGYGDYRRFVFELTCFRQAGCDRTNFNAVDANTMTLILADRQDPSTSFVGSATVNGSWVRGEQAISWYESDQGSGLRFSRLKVDNATLGDGTIDYQANGGCDTGWTGVSGEFARRFNPCTGGPYQRWYGFKTQNFADGQHSFAICLQDYGQYRSGGESCDNRTIHTDNTAPGKPAALAVTSANPARYLDHFGAQFTLSPNAGSPIVKVHYYITDASGKVVVPEKVISATNPTTLSSIEGPAKAGAYTLNVSLEDQVGFVGPGATVEVPHDTTPPAAPQNLQVAGTPAHRVPKFDLSWQNVTDAGSPIDTAHYQVIDESGNVVAPAQTAAANNVEAIHDINTPADPGNYKVRVWLSDAEGNVGAAATVPVPRDTTPPAAPQDVSVTAPATPRSAQGFDVHWRNLTDDGAPINAVHYRIVNDGGGEVVPIQTINGDNSQAIPNLETPRSRGTYTLQLWLSDAEDNASAPVKVPLAFNCVRAEVAGGTNLTAGLGSKRTSSMVVNQGQGTALTGNLTSQGGALENTPLCVFSRVVTHEEPEFLGVALTGTNGHYKFAIGAGPSRDLSVVYRPDERELTTDASLASKVRPSFRLMRRPVRNKGFAIFKGAIPGPDNDKVVLVLQVKSGKGWRVFRRYRTHKGGHFVMRYRFTQTYRPTTYIMRVQVRAQSGYPYRAGASKRIEVPVRP